MHNTYRRARYWNPGEKVAASISSKKKKVRMHKSEIEDGDGSRQSAFRKTGTATTPPQTRGCLPRNGESARFLHSEEGSGVSRLHWQKLESEIEAGLSFLPSNSLITNKSYQRKQTLAPAEISADRRPYIVLGCQYIGPVWSLHLEHWRDRQLSFLSQSPHISPF